MRYCGAAGGGVGYREVSTIFLKYPRGTRQFLKELHSLAILNIFLIDFIHCLP